MVTMLAPQAIGRNLDALDTDDLLAEWRGVLRERGEVTARRDQLAADLARREEEHAGVNAQMRQVWGRPGLTLPAAPQGAAEQRATLAATEAHLVAIAERRGAVGAALARRVAREEAAIATERAACDEDERALGERLARLRELTAPLVAFEGIGVGGDGRLPLQGLTWHLEAGLRSRREQLLQRERRLTSLRRVAAETTAVE